MAISDSRLTTIDVTAFMHACPSPVGIAQKYVIISQQFANIVSKLEYCNSSSENK